MTRQEEWEVQERIYAELFADSVWQITGRHKRNTRDRGEYKGLSKSAVTDLIDRAQKADAKKRQFKCSMSEKAAMLARYDETLANLGLATTQDTPDCLMYVADVREIPPLEGKDSSRGECNCDVCRKKRGVEAKMLRFIDRDPETVAEVAWQLDVPVSVMSPEELDRVPGFTFRSKRVDEEAASPSDDICEENFDGVD